MSTLSIKVILRYALPTLLEEMTRLLRIPLPKSGMLNDIEFLNIWQPCDFLELCLFQDIYAFYDRIEAMPIRILRCY